MRYFSPLKTKDIISLIGLVVLGFIWTLVDQIFFKNSSQRFIVFILVVFILYFLQFAFNAPDRIWHYANTIALISVIFSITVSIIMHVIIRHDFSIKSLLISVIVLCIPYLAGVVYLFTLKK